MVSPPATKAERTRLVIRDAAIRLFRTKGVSATTMREIAEEAGVATGIAYRYFPSKDAILFGVYRLHTERVDAALEKRQAASGSDAASVGTRLQCLLDAEVDVLTASHTRLLRALTQSALNAESPAWIFANETAPFREHAEVHVRWVLERAPLHGESLDVAVKALWALRLTLLYYAVHDTSPRHVRTRRLIAEVGPMLDQVMPFAPFATPALEAVARMMRVAIE